MQDKTLPCLKPDPTLIIIPSIREISKEQAKK